MSSPIKMTDGSSRMASSSALLMALPKRMSGMLDRRVGDRRVGGEVERRGGRFLRGLQRLRDLHVEHVEIVRDDWDFSGLPYVGPYGDQSDVIVFRDLSRSPMDSGRDRVEADASITEPIHQLIVNADIAAHRWMAGKVELDPPE